MVKIRLSRNGSNKRPFYQIVVTDNRSARNGRFIEKIGFFDPMSKNKLYKFKINLNKFKYWIKTGGQTSERIKSLIKKYIKKND